MVHILDFVCTMEHILDTVCTMVHILDTDNNININNLRTQSIFKPCIELFAQSGSLNSVILKSDHFNSMFFFSNIYIKYT
jgi:hypothetical protein